MYCCFTIALPENGQAQKLVESKLFGMLKHYDFKKYRLAQEMSIIVKEDRLNVAWQVALELECEGFAVGYGLGKTEAEASERAHKKWINRITGEQSERLSM